MYKDYVLSFFDNLTITYCLHSLTLNLFFLTMQHDYPKTRSLGALLGISLVLSSLDESSKIGKFLFITFSINPGCSVQGHAVQMHMQYNALHCTLGSVVLALPCNTSKFVESLPEPHLLVAGFPSQNY